MKIATIPAERIYWGLIDGAGLERPEARRFRLERCLPEPVDGLHVSEIRIDTHRWLMVAASPETIHGQVASCAVAPWHLIPDRLPDHIAAQGIGDDLRPGLNLLHGRHEPATRRHLRHLIIACSLMAALICIVFLIIGLERRRTRFLIARESQEQSDNHALRLALPEAASGQIHPEAALAMALRKLDLMATADSPTGPDAGLVMQSLLSHWPAINLPVTELRVTADTIVLHITSAEPAKLEGLRSATADLRIGDVRFRAQDTQITSGSAGTAMLTWTRDHSP